MKANGKDRTNAQILRPPATHLWLQVADLPLHPLVQHATLVKSKPTEAARCHSKLLRAQLVVLSHPLDQFLQQRSFLVAFG